MIYLAGNFSLHRKGKNSLHLCKKEAEAWIKKFSEENPNDSRVQAYQKHKVELDEILKKPPQFEISKSAYSTSQSDFAATLFNGQIVFTSAKNGMSKELYQRTNQPYLDLFKAEIDDAAVIVLGIPGRDDRLARPGDLAAAPAGDRCGFAEVFFRNVIQCDHFHGDLLSLVGCYAGNYPQVILAASC